MLLFILFVVLSIVIIVVARHMTKELSDLKTMAINAKVKAEKFDSLMFALRPLRELPKVCKFCSTIGYQHHTNCPYVIVSFAIYHAEND